MLLELSWEITCLSRVIESAKPNPYTIILVFTKQSLDMLLSDNENLFPRFDSRSISVSLASKDSLNT